MRGEPVKVSRTFVKICGLRCPPALGACGDADAVGIVVDPRSRRCVAPETARDLVRSAPCPAYLVSTSTDATHWCQLAEATGARCAQVHAPDGTEAVSMLQDSYGMRVMQAFFVPEASADPRADAQALCRAIDRSHADMALLDTGAGTGRAHDRAVSRLVARDVDIVLAGGLSPETVQEALRDIGPAGVDVSSGVESGGRQDPEKIQAFLTAVRSMEVVT